MNLDRAYTDAILSRTEVFSRVHPNAITLTGLAIDFVILYAVFAGMLWLVGFGLFARYSCDCLDGAVARKYKKVSDLGGVLDTIADNTLIFILVLSISMLAQFGAPWIIATAVTAANLVYLWCAKSLVHHHGVKRGGNFVQRVYTFGVNNNMLLYIAAFAAIWGLS